MRRTLGPACTDIARITAVICPGRPPGPGTPPPGCCPGPTFIGSSGGSLPKTKCLFCQTPGRGKSSLGPHLSSNLARLPKDLEARIDVSFTHSVTTVGLFLGGARL